MEKQHQLRQLYRKFLDNQYSEQDLRQLQQHFRQEDEAVIARLVAEAWQDISQRAADAQSVERVLVKADSGLRMEMDKRLNAIAKRGFARLAIAASICLLLGFGIYLYLQSQGGTGVEERFAADVLPGKDMAILTLSDGRKIALDEAANGELAEESGIKITKTEDGQLVYEVLRHAPQARASESRIADARQPKAGSAGWRASVMRDPATYNTIETPKGGQYKIILPDGSKVWLNAASTLRYPSRFSAAERRVELTGEAFFSVTKSLSPSGEPVPLLREGRNGQGDGRGRRVPFIVQTQSQEVTVLGTQFNINAYTDEALVKTTLVEGAVRVASTSAQSTDKLTNQSTNKLTNPPVVGHGQSTDLQLVPGEQAVLADGKISVRQVDTESYTSWKDNYFIFSNTELRDIMRQLQRWYGVEVDLAAMPRQTFYGEISRDVKLSEVLKLLEATSDLKFRIAERRIMLEK